MAYARWHGDKKMSRCAISPARARQRAESARGTVPPARSAAQNDQKSVYAGLMMRAMRPVGEAFELSSAVAGAQRAAARTRSFQRRGAPRDARHYALRARTRARKTPDTRFL